MIIFVAASGNGAIRLFQNGEISFSFTSGIVQIYYDNEWGNICDDVGFDLGEANVICRQLGYASAYAHGSASSGTLWVNCLKVRMNKWMDR